MADVIYSLETNFGTWVTPATWIRVESANIQSAREYDDLNVSGVGRDLFMSVPNAKPVNGAIVTPWWGVGIGSLIYSYMRNLVTANPNAGVYDHNMLFDDTLPLRPISFQQRYSPALAINVLSAIVASATIGLVAKERARLTLNCEAKDEAPAGGTWDFDGSASPAVLATPAYPAALRPLMFYDATVVVGGTPSIANNRITIAGGTVATRFKSCEIGIDNGVDTDGFALVTDPTRTAIDPGQRAITLNFDRKWDDLDLTFYNAWRSGANLSMDIALVGPVITGAFRREAHFTFPSLAFNPAPLPEINGEATPQNITVAARALRNTTVDAAMGVWIRTSEATL